MQKISAGKFHFEPPSPFTSLDDLVGAGEQLRRDFEAKGPGRVQVDEEFKLGRPQHGLMGRLLVIKDSAGGVTELAVYVGLPRARYNYANRFDEISAGLA